MKDRSDFAFVMLFVCAGWAIACVWLGCYGVEQFAGTVYVTAVLFTMCIGLAMCAVFAHGCVLVLRDARTDESEEGE